MRAILGSPSSSGSAIVTAQSYRYNLLTEFNLKHKYRHIVINKLPPSSSSVPAVHSSHSPFLSTVRCDLPPRENYYADEASELAEEWRLEEFAMILEGVVDSGGNASKFVSMLSTDLLARGFLKSLRGGGINSVFEVLKKIDKLGIAPLKLFDGSGMKLLKNECQRILKFGEVEMFVYLVEVLSGFGFPVKELGDPSRVVQFCVNKRDTNLAIRYACIVPHAPIVFCIIIREFGKKRDVVSALTVYEASKKKLTSPNMYICRTIIDTCGLCNDYRKSRCIYEDLLGQNITLNVYVFNSLMNVNAHDLIFTLEVYKNMQKLGVMADMASYNILLKACCLAGRADLAQEIYGEVKHLELKGVLKLDVFTYSTIIKVLTDAKLWQMALKVKEDMLSAGVAPNTITWSSLINACASASLVEHAMHLFEEMLQAGCEPNSQCCNILLQACVEACQYDRAFRLFWSWKQTKIQESLVEDNNDKSDVISSIKHKQMKCVTDTPNFITNSNHLSFARRFPFKPTTATYNILMKACGTDYYRAKSLIDEMRTVGLSPNHISWSILINTCGGLGNVEGALQILKIMHAEGMSPDVVAYTTAIKVCVKNKKLKLAFSLFEEMKQYQLQPNLVTYNTLLRARSRYGSLHEVQQCLAVYQEMRKAGYKPNDYYLKELIEEWCEGVMQDNNQNQGELTSSRRFKSQRPQGLLLETVAVHLQKGSAENPAIDLQGLTKVEARIVVLAVLRMTKENHSLGLPVKDDLMIILGPNKVDEIRAKNDLEMKDAILKLLQNDLGLKVSPDGPIIEIKGADSERPLDSDSNLVEKLGTKRPAILDRLMVTKKSLHHWLQRVRDAAKG